MHTDPDKFSAALYLYRLGKSQLEVSETVGISRSTASKYYNVQEAAGLIPPRARPLPQAGYAARERPRHDGRAEYHARSSDGR